MPLRLCKSAAAALPSQFMTRKPTVGEVLQACQRVVERDNAPLEESHWRAMRKFLPKMLCGEPWNEADANNVVLTQYSQGTHVYVYFNEMKRLDKKYDPPLPKTIEKQGRNKLGRWLTSSARFLILWKAEELKWVHGVGNGWRDVFCVTPPTKAQRNARRERRPDSPRAPAPAPLPVALFTAEMESAFLDFQSGSPGAAHRHRPPSPPPLRTGEMETVRLDVFPAPRYRVPSALVQGIRTLGNCHALRRHLRKKKMLTMSNSRVHTEVKWWLRHTPEGREVIAACDVDPDAFDVDHVWPVILGGPDVVENYHIMPSGVNSHFRDLPWNAPEKARYVGEEQTRLVRDLARQGRDTLPWHLLTKP